MILKRFSEWDADYVTMVSAADHDDPDGPYRMAILDRAGSEIAIIEASGNEVMDGVIIDDAGEVARLVDALEEYANGDE